MKNKKFTIRAEAIKKNATTKKGKKVLEKIAKNKKEENFLRQESYIALEESGIVLELKEDLFKTPIKKTENNNSTPSGIETTPVNKTNEDKPRLESIPFDPNNIKDIKFEEPNTDNNEPSGREFIQLSKEDRIALNETSPTKKLNNTLYKER